MPHLANIAAMCRLLHYVFKSPNTNITRLFYLSGLLLCHTQVCSYTQVHMPAHVHIKYSSNQFGTFVHYGQLGFSVNQK